MRKAKEFALSLEISSAADIVACAQAAEQAGFGTLWLPEDPFFRGAFALAGAVAASTSSLRVGIGVLNPYTRHPAITAMEFGTLDEISHGRAILGIGAGVRFWMEDQLHLEWKRPQRAIRETVEIVRGLLAGERLDYSGQLFSLTDAGLHFSPPRAHPPIHLGVVGPKNLQMAGAIADGVILSTLTSPAYVRFARNQIRIGAESARRNLNDFELSAMIPICMSGDGSDAREAVRSMIAILLGIGAAEAGSPILTCVGFAPELLAQFRSRFAAGDLPLDLVSDEMIDTFAVAGTPAHCIDRISEFVEAGLDVPIAAEIPAVNPRQVISDIERHLFPVLM